MNLSRLTRIIEEIKQAADEACNETIAELAKAALDEISGPSHGYSYE